MNQQLLSTDEAADYLGLSPYVLQRDRCDPHPTIPVIYVRPRTPRYSVADLDHYLEERRLGSGVEDDLEFLDEDQEDALQDEHDEEEIQ
jgi:hypothetical protein